MIIKPKEVSGEYDFCIIGGGIAGITCSLELEGSGSKILILESGLEKSTKLNQKLFEGELANNLHPPADKYRYRQAGGSSSQWGGRCVPFDEIDFEKRDYIHKSGWPLKTVDLESFYEGACHYLDIGKNNFEGFDDNDCSSLIEGFESSNFSDDSVERLSKPTNFWKKYKNNITKSKSIFYCLDATVVDIERSSDLLQKVVFKNSALESFEAKAKKFIFCQGGLETTRFFLNMVKKNSHFLAEERKILGKYYMCHLAGVAGKIYPKRNIDYGYGKDEEVYIRRRYKIIPDAQRNYKIGNFIVRIHFPDISDPEHNTGILSLLYFISSFIGYEYGNRLSKGSTKSRFISFFKHLKNLIFDIKNLSYEIFNLVFYRIFADRKKMPLMKAASKYYSFDFHSEQEPNPNSNISLSNNVDKYGLNKLKINWNYSKKDIETINIGLKLLTREILQSNLAHIEISDTEIYQESIRYGAYGGHHIGTTRSGLNCSDSVVDKNLKIHSMRNVYICSTSVFPTSSQANPTFTLVVLALRLSKYLRKSE
tara:strand:- start:17905 stop:19518 length:1614 start_codon:yes stop_codon:yes gene_type:complete